MAAYISFQPKDFFNTVLYTGDGVAIGSGGNAITGVGFQPDFIWSKARSSGYTGSIYDSVRGAGAARHLTSSETEAEGTANWVYGHISAFGADGYTLSEGSDGGNPYANENESGTTYVSWNWLAGNATLGTGDFTQGTLASTCSRNVDAGFSIVNYVGNAVADATFGHGLSKAPEFVMVKNREEGDERWTVWGAHFDRMFLNNTDANTNTSYDAAFNSTLVLTDDVANAWNESGDDHIAYCWHSVDGFSKMGSYAGNSSADGTFVYLGFRPAFVMWKKTNSADDWGIHDNKREESTNANPIDNYLRPNVSAVEGDDGDSVDFLSNGFKWRLSSGLRNNSGDTYIYIAFAETPFKYSNAR